MSEVQLVNETGQDIVLYEGSGGIYRSLKTIRRGMNYLLKDNPNETYREFQCKLRSRSSQKCEAVVLRPFVFRECEEVTITWDQATDTLSYETKKRESGSNAAAAAAKPRQASPRLFQRLLNRWRRERAPSDGSVGGNGGNGGGSGDDVPRCVGALNSHNPVLSSNV